MKDFLLDAGHDLVLKNFDLVLTNDIEGLRQRVKQKLLFIKGEWFFNENLGTEYFDAIANKDTDTLTSILLDSVREVEGVKNVTSFDVKIDEVNRTLSLKFEVSNNLGETIGDSIISNI